MNNLLVDTNILIYAIDKKSKFFTRSQEIITNPAYSLFTTSKNLSEFLSVVKRHPKSSISTAEAVKILKSFQDYFQVLYPSQVSYNRFISLLEKYKPTGIKVHDYEIVSIALANNVKQIATLNKKDFGSIKEIDLVTITM